MMLGFVALLAEALKLCDMDETFPSSCWVVMGDTWEYSTKSPSPDTGGYEYRL